MIQILKQHGELVRIVGPIAQETEFVPTEGGQKLERIQHRLVETIQRPQISEDGTIGSHDHSSQDEICQ